LEFNCRFGDPETQVVLPLLETDLYEVFVACCDGKLNEVDIRFRENLAATTVVCAAMGYPETYPKGMKITGTSEANDISGIKVYHAGTVLDQNGILRCSGGRVLAVTGIGSGLRSSIKIAYQGVNCIDFLSEDNNSLIHRRTDIAKGALQKKLRIGVLGSTRGSALIPIMESIQKGNLNAEIVAVISNKSDALILEKGRSLGINVTTKFVSAKGLNREKHDAECTAILEDAGADLVLLIGYMRILSKPFCDYWAGRCLNVHPSLLPKFAGGMDLQVSLTGVVNLEE
jgi:Formyl transferase/Phosphoribosylglycinamide synthetase, C domain